MPETYTCRGCQRVVDAALEPSPREPNYCGDCTVRVDREVA